MPFEIIKYLESPPNFNELKVLMSELDLDARALMRTFEAPYKDNNLDESFLLGKSRMLTDGDVCTIFVTGGILEEVWGAHDELENAGYKTRIVSVHTLKPFDSDAVLNAAEQTGGIVSVEENTINGGLGSLLAETLMENSTFPKRFLRIGLNSEFSSIIGSQKYLRKCYNLDAKSVVTKVLELIQKNANITKEKQGRNKSK